MCMAWVAQICCRTWAVVLLSFFEVVAMGCPRKSSIPGRRAVKRIVHTTCTVAYFSTLLFRSIVSTSLRAAPRPKMPQTVLYEYARFFSSGKGMSMDVTTSRQDMTVQLHLDTVTLQDRARPDDSPFRNMIYSMPDETSHGGLIHVAYWVSAGGVRRVPPASIAETNEEYDMVVDARFSTLKVYQGRTARKGAGCVR